MKKLLFAAILLLSTQANAQTVTGFYSHEVISGLNKLCYYTSVRGTFVLTLRATSLCPLTAQFPG